ncbi:hypothetical protein DIPPA_13972 [Diplonema papillatum]|nr:hypothetical protein DIPPA_13972 [Diplonema papillatum]
MQGEGEALLVVHAETGKRARVLLKYGVENVEIGRLKRHLVAPFGIPAEQQTLTCGGRAIKGDQFRGRDVGLRPGCVVEVGKQAPVTPLRAADRNAARGTRRREPRPFSPSVAVRESVYASDTGAGFEQADYRSPSRADATQPASGTPRVTMYALPAEADDPRFRRGSGSTCSGPASLGSRRHSLAVESHEGAPVQRRLGREAEVPPRQAAERRTPGSVARGPTSCDRAQDRRDGMTFGLPSDSARRRLLSPGDTASDLDSAAESAARSRVGVHEAEAAGRWCGEDGGQRRGSVLRAQLFEGPAGPFGADDGRLRDHRTTVDDLRQGSASNNSRTTLPPQRRGSHGRANSCEHDVHATATEQQRTLATDCNTVMYAETTLPVQRRPVPAALASEESEDRRRQHGRDEPRQQSVSGGSGRTLPPQRQLKCPILEPSERRQQSASESSRRSLQSIAGASNGPLEVQSVGEEAQVDDLTRAASASVDSRGRARDTRDRPLLTPGLTAHDAQRPGSTEPGCFESHTKSAGVSLRAQSNTTSEGRAIDATSARAGPNLSFPDVSPIHEPFTPQQHSTILAQHVVPHEVSLFPSYQEAVLFPSSTPQPVGDASACRARHPEPRAVCADSPPAPALVGRRESYCRPAAEAAACRRGAPALEESAVSTVLSPGRGSGGVGWEPRPSFCGDVAVGQEGSHPSLLRPYRRRCGSCRCDGAGEQEDCRKHPSCLSHGGVSCHAEDLRREHHASFCDSIVADPCDCLHDSFLRCAGVSKHSVCAQHSSSCRSSAAGQEDRRPSRPHDSGHGSSREHHREHRRRAETGESGPRRGRRPSLPRSDGGGGDGLAAQTLPSGGARCPERRRSRSGKRRSRSKKARGGSMRTSETSCFRGAGDRSAKPGCSSGFPYQYVSSGTNESSHTHASDGNEHGERRVVHRRGPAAADLWPGDGEQDSDSNYPWCCCASSDASRDSIKPQSGARRGENRREPANAGLLSRQNAGRNTSGGNPYRGPLSVTPNSSQTSVGAFNDQQRQEGRGAGSLQGSSRQRTVRTFNSPNGRAEDSISSFSCETDNPHRLAGVCGTGRLHETGPVGQGSRWTGGNERDEWGTARRHSGSTVEYLPGGEMTRSASECSFRMSAPAVSLAESVADRSSATGTGASSPGVEDRLQRRRQAEKQKLEELQEAYAALVVRQGELRPDPPPPVKALARAPLSPRVQVPDRRVNTYAPSGAKPASPMRRGKYIASGRLSPPLE